MVSKNSKTKTINSVNVILKEYFVRKGHSEEEVDNQVGLIVNGLYGEIWDLNKERIIEELENENVNKLTALEENLKNEYKKKDNISSFKKMIELFFEGIFVAAIVSLGVNQMTDLIAIFKEFIFDSSKVEIWVSTIVVLLIIIFILVCLIGKYFVDKIKELYNEVYK